MFGRTRIAFASAALALGVLSPVVTPAAASAATPEFSRIGTARPGEVVSIDDSGRYVAFGRADNDLGAGPDTQVRVFDTTTRRNTIVSVTSNGVPALAPAISGGPSMASGGRYVAFMSTADLVGAPGTTGDRRIWRRDLQTNTTVLVSRGVHGAEINGFGASISGDGRYVIFGSSTGSVYNSVYLRDLVKGTTKALGAVADDFYLTTAISPDARFMAWTEGDYLRVVDRSAGKTTRVRPGDLLNGRIAFTDGGDAIVYRTTSSSGAAKVYLDDIAAGQSRLTPAKTIDAVDRGRAQVASGDMLYDLKSGARVFGSLTCARDGSTVVGAGSGLFGVMRPPAAGEVDPHLWLAREPNRAYRLVAADGGVFTYGGAKFYGSAANLPLRAPIVTMASTLDGRGYWLIASDGGVFTYGNARFLGSLGALQLNSPIVGMAPTPDGKGYWLVASDGGVFAFGSAKFHGSLGALKLASPITGIAAAADGKGYWLVARDGGVFAFGSATFHGSAAGAAQNAVIGIGAAPDRNGYWLATDVGGLFAYGSATHLGSLKSLGVTPQEPIVAFRSARDTCGYRFAASDGGVFPFGGSGFEGSAGNLPLVSPIVSIG
jgi:hypothetical protein